MPKLRLFSASEQVAAFLREELQRGTWRGEMPGVGSLAADLGVNHKTVEAALRLLEEEGVLEGQGPRRPRRISLAPDKKRTNAMRVALLVGEPSDKRVDYIVEIRHELTEAGHAPLYPAKTLSDLGNDLDRLARLVNATAADAWIVTAGSREVLGWFAEQPFPVFGLFGRLGDLRLAGTGPTKSEAYAAAVRDLAKQGHRRIVLLARPARRTPVPGKPEQAFLTALGAQGITVSDYNFPNWENSRQGFQRCLESLFRVTPPTALVVQETVLFGAVQQYLIERGIRVPGKVSLVCADPDPSFAWREPSVAHIGMESGPWVRRAVRWANNVSKGKDDRRWTSTKAFYVPGGTVGPVPR